MNYAKRSGLIFVGLVIVEFITFFAFVTGIITLLRVRNLSANFMITFCFVVVFFMAATYELYSHRFTYKGLLGTDVINGKVISAKDNTKEINQLVGGIPDFKKKRYILVEFAFRSGQNPVKGKTQFLFSTDEYKDYKRYIPSAGDSVKILKSRISDSMNDLLIPDIAAFKIA